MACACLLVSSPGYQPSHRRGGKPAAAHHRDARRRGPRCHRHGGARPALFICQSVDDLTHEGLVGLVFAVLVILGFLLSVRATLVTAVSIPLSVLIVMIVLDLGGHTLNMLTLGALTVAVGRVVDDSIVVIENIKRHLSYGGPRQVAILDASARWP